jgi:hypothetical protein
VGEVYGAVEGVDYPGWAGINKVLFGGAGGVGFFAYEGVCWVALGYCVVNEGFDLCCGKWVSVIDLGRQVFRAAASTSSVEEDRSGTHHDRLQ